MNKALFIASAPALKVSVSYTGHDGRDVAVGTFNATARQFQSGSVGYHFSGKVSLHEVALTTGDPIRLQVGANVTAVGSKTWA